MNNLNLKIDKEKCIHCALCIKDCVSCVLEFDENKFPTIARGGESRCIKCQHCLAICPTGALSIFDKDPKNSVPKGSINSDELLNLIKTRRSFRQFKRENVSKEAIDKFKDMLKFIPTGCNARALDYIFVDNIDEMDNYRDICINKLRSLAWLLPSKLSNYKKSILEGEDVVFREAPHMLIVTVDKKAPCKDVDPVIALSYFDLYAQSLGVGTLWCGFAKMAFEMFKDMRKFLNIEKNHKIGYVILFGIPKVSYLRAIQPD